MTITSYILGVDLSLTATGIAQLDTAGREFTTTTLDPGKRTGLDRLDWIVERLAGLAVGSWYVAMEGPAFASMGQKMQHERAGLWWLAYRELLGWSKVAVIPPSSLKSYALGKGNGKGTDKDAMMLATARRFPTFDGDNNQADALWLAHAAADHLGVPLIDMPAANRASLAKFTWPEVA